MKTGYRWTLNLKGQYVDGHEYNDVKKYQNNNFYASMAKFEEHTRKNGAGDTPKDT